MFNANRVAPARLDTRPNVQEDPALAVTSASVALRSMQSPGISLRAHKVCLQLPDADRAKCCSLKPCNGPNIPPIEGITCIHAASESSYILLDLGGVFAGQSLHAGFGIFC